MGIVGAAQICDYAASKAALISLNESLRYELNHWYVPVNIIIRSILLILYCPVIIARKFERR